MRNDHFASPKQHDPVSKLVFELSKLPGIGEKTATRLAYHIIKQDNSYCRALADAVLSAKEQIRLCSSCFTFTDTDPCRLCAGERRTSSVICVVERPSDVMTIEQTGVHRGLYHVLHGVLSPLDGVGPEDIKIRELLRRIETGAPGGESIREVILATNPSVEGEATCLYISRLLKPAGVKVTRLAYGLPIGGTLEYTDRQTISKALENRVEVDSAGGRA